MTSMIPFTDKGSLPAHLKAFVSETNEFSGSVSTFPVISLKGKVFTVVRGNEKTLVTKPGTDDEPAAALEVVILDVGPKGNLYAKTFYANGYTEGSNAKPDCYSDDGIAPAADAQNKQATKCALCPQNAVGSGATSQNPKAKACRSSKLLAVAPAGQISDPMLLRVPGWSTLKLKEYGDFLANRGVHPSAVITRIGFDYSVAHPALTFKAIGFVTKEMADEIVSVKGSSVVKMIIGDKSVVVDEAEIETLPAPTAEPVVKAPAETKAVRAAEDDLPKTKRATVKVEDAVEAAPVVKKSKAVSVVEEDVKDIESALDELDFDD